MATLKIRTYGDPVLREKARPVTAITERHRQLAHDMAETMYQGRGIGLAANQVGETDRLVVVDVDWPDHEDKKGYQPSPTFMFNPEVLEESPEDEHCKEGCLSLPGIDGEVWRPLWIRYRYQDMNGQWQERKASDLLARCILHEIDHLDGRLFIDRVAPDSRRQLAGKLGVLREGQPETAL